MPGMEPAARERPDSASPPIKVLACRKWNDSGVDVRQGDLLAVSPVGADHRWTDWFISADAGGYVRWWTPFTRRFRRCPDAELFELVGCVGMNETACFRLTEKAPKSGRLYLFANDLPFMYWNNRGALEVRISRRS